MPHHKKSIRRGNSHHGGGRPELETSFLPFSGTSATGTKHPKGFTLQEEARNTERHQSFWNTDQGLRHSKVNFISAGPIDPSGPKDAESALAGMSLESPKEMNSGENAHEAGLHLRHTTRGGSPAPVQTFSQFVEEAQQICTIREEGAVSDPTTPQSGESERQPEADSSAEDETFMGFVIDTLGTQPVKTGIAPPPTRAASPTPSDSSEEVILFGGRDAHGRALSRAPVSKIPTLQIPEKIKTIEDKIYEKEVILNRILHQTPTPPQQDSLIKIDAAKTHHSRRGHRSHKDNRQEEEDALISDYIANIDPDDVSISRLLNQRDLGGAENDIWLETEESSGELAGQTSKSFHADWDRSDIYDFDDLSTSDGVMGNVQAILSKRSRDAGIQYLIVWEDQTVDEARWVPASTVLSLNSKALVDKFEEEEKLVAEFIDEEASTTDSDDIDGADEENGEADLEQSFHMSDETIARLLAKQEELGMGSADLILFDDDIDDEEEEEEDEEEEKVSFSRNPFSQITLSTKKAVARGRGDKRPRGEFPAASVLADAYDGFDVMDFERPSLKKTSKGRKGKLDFDVSDSELEASMQMAWDNDRNKKKERKQNREQLRAQGLLGSKNGKPDLKQKYKEGMGIHAVKDEIKKFLISKNTTLSLPPMDKADRKIVHELANVFKLKSKSAGTGNARFPILIRTSRTTVFVERTFDAVEAKLTRRYLPRLDVGGNKTGAGIKRASRGGGANNAAVSYRDGDVVGGSAPQLGVENRGRAMLEKMGWSSGTALGALNNKGILEPVSHIVKTTKAGLG